MVKTGISGTPLNKNGTSRRGNSQANKWTKDPKKSGKFEAKVKEENIPGRAAALESEKKATDKLFGEGNDLREQSRPKPFGR